MPACWSSPLSALSALVSLSGRPSFCFQPTYSRFTWSCSAIAKMEIAQAQLAQMKLMSVGLSSPRVDIDRRHCTRVVPMKVLCLGMPRTGTACKKYQLSYNELQLTKQQRCAWPFCNWALQMFITWLSCGWRTPKTTPYGLKHIKPNSRARARNGAGKNGMHY